MEENGENMKDYEMEQLNIMEKLKEAEQNNKVEIARNIKRHILSDSDRLSKKDSIAPDNSSRVTELIKNRFSSANPNNRKFSRVLTLI